MAEKHEIDPISGTPLSHHQCDGIRELETKPPRWWAMTFIACVVFTIGYCVVYPALPIGNDFSRGTSGWLSRTDVEAALKRAEAAQAGVNDKLRAMPVDAILKDPDLRRAAQAGGRAAFVNNCAQCHGAGGNGQAGYPNLLDDDWLWGGKPADIQRTLQVGINGTHPDTRATAMPAFGTTGALTRPQIDDVAEHVLSLSGKPHNAEAAGRGAKIFAEQCVACHGETGQGNREFGAPNLRDNIWLYGGDKATIVQTITQSRKGVMPAWEGKLSELTIKQLTVYVHTLGGGE